MVCTNNDKFLFLKENESNVWYFLPKSREVNCPSFLSSYTKTFSIYEYLCLEYSGIIITYLPELNVNQCTFKETKHKKAYN